MRKRIEESETHFQKALEESKRGFMKELAESKNESRRAYSAAMTTMMELRAPIYQLQSGHQVGPKYRAKRNAVAHGGSVLMDISILRHLDTSPGGRTAVFTKWAVGFEDIYGLPFRYVETLSEGSRMVTLLNIRADVLLLDVYSSYDQSENIEQQCKSVLRQWKVAVDSERDPEGIFDGAAVLSMYDKIVELHNAAQP
ncbi:hypothetical protein MGYG_08678 [Nannizzia gypsea CBS 118893]|uniref:Uncharacterized protein n=1 Tax=Arthroderma gypseum (strain ATCC MYA-4604 / CBS 118893) TaxID=535722 RepID=E4V6N8_ARTGP|nr:hypothetical protein MGYG_08678 [Nannizzia gypsea CBS 118893]EFQ96754.1 hypothetical protein MGYG_08678 [Nannizzia gypsea CBS 118893]